MKIKEISQEVDYREMRGDIGMIPKRPEYKVVYDPGNGTDSHVFVKETDNGLRLTGPGLFEYLDEGNVIPYTPGESTRIKEYQLTEEEHARFDAIPNCTPEEIAEAKRIYAKIHAGEKVSSIDELAEQINEIWYSDRKGQHGERDLVFGTNAAGLKMFDDAIRKQFAKTAIEGYWEK